MLSDADYCHIAVLDTGFRQRFFIQILNHQGVFCDISQFPHLFLITVQDQQIHVRPGQFHSQGIAEPSQPHDSVRHFCVFPIVKYAHFLLL